MIEVDEFGKEHLSINCHVTWEMFDDWLDAVIPSEKEKLSHFFPLLTDSSSWVYSGDYIYSIKDGKLFTEKWEHS